MTNSLSCSSHFPVLQSTTREHVGFRKVSVTIMGNAEHPGQPSLPWRVGSSIVMGFIGTLAHGWMKGANHSEVHGLDGFIELLDKREDIEGRDRGLITGTPKTIEPVELLLILVASSLEPYQRVRTYHRQTALLEA